MPIFENALKSKAYNANSPSIDAHFKLIRDLFPTLFEGKSFNTYMQQAIHAATASLKKNRVTEAQEKEAFGKLPGGTASRIRTEFIAAVEKAINDAMEGLEPLPPRGGIQSNYAALKQAGSVVLNKVGLEARLDNNGKMKIAAIFDYGNTYKGHGPTRNLGAGVLHAHVGNGDGVAFSWAGNVLTIYAVGKKSDAAKPGNSGYNWTTG